MKYRDKKTGKHISENLTKKCLVCNKEFKIKRCLLNRRKYCSMDCFSKSKIGVKQSKETIDKKIKSNTGKKRSEEFRLSVSLRQLGSGNSNYNGGWTKDKKEKLKYEERKRYGKTKDEWIEYFGGRCSICGITNYEHLVKNGIRLSIHHKDKRGRNTNNPNNNVENIVLVCNSCHGKIHLDSKRALEMRNKQINN